MTGINLWMNFRHPQTIPQTSLGKNAIIEESDNSLGKTARTLPSSNPKFSDDRISALCVSSECGSSSVDIGIGRIDN